MIVCCIPRLVQFYCETGIPALEIRQVNAVIQLWNNFFPAQKLAEVQLYSYSGGNDMDISLQGFFCNWRFYRNFFTGFFPLYFPFTVYGIIVVIRKKLWDLKYTVVLFLFVSYNLFHFLIEASAGRYFLINCVFALPFTVRGVNDLFVFSRKHLVLNRVVTAAIVVIAGVLIYKSVFFTNSHHAKEYRMLEKVIRQEFPGRANLLLIGEDRGVGYYLNVNVCHYRNYPTGLASRISLSDILEHGIDCKEVSYKHQRGMKSPVFFDLILLHHSEKAEFTAWYPQVFSDSQILAKGKKHTLYRIQKNESSREER